MARSLLHHILAIYLVYSVLDTTTIAAAVSSSEVLALLQRDTGSCPNSFDHCANSKLPADFCCPSSSTCISLDNASSAICCPEGSDCSFIQPITCDIQLQNVTAHPTNSLKTTKLDDSLPKCGDSCCPFGYTCQNDNTCALDKDTSSSATSSANPSTSAAATSSTQTTVATASSETGYTSSVTSETSAPSATPSIAITANPSATDSANPTTTSPYSSTSTWDATSLAGLSTTSPSLTPKCPSFPTKAIIAGFFPGLLCGVIITLLVTICFKRRSRRRVPPVSKIPHIRQRSSDGGIIGISGPIMTEENSFRSDFLRRNGLSRNSVGGRSILHRSRSRVRSLFATGPPKGNIYTTDRSAPPLPVTPPRQIIPQRPPSTESITVFSPEAFASSDVLNPSPYPPRPNTTFTEMIDNVGFKNSDGNPYYRVTETPKPPSQTQSPPRRLA
ncbi:hypothetical protein DTO217A2_1540 [Paecilomyces variotii]|nr:hypothetical protein DTO217A2_1540 [Paecilomyces variotii]